MDQDQETSRVTRRLSIENREEKRFLEVPFSVGEDVEEVRLTMTIERPDAGSATIDLGLRDVVGIRGWSGGARSVVRIGEETATPGYRPGPIGPGDWAVILGLYEVPADGVTVVLEVECRPVRPRWVSGDLHSHTLHSDGSFTIDQAASQAEALGLTFLAMTDHNTYSQNLFYPRDSHTILIPGMELTTYFGHANLLGVVDPVDDFRVMSESDLRARLAVASERGAIISINHPFETTCASCAWQWGNDELADAVEVWNGPWRLANAEALAWWQSVLVSGKRMVAVGGSDVHNSDQPDVRHGWPTTWVYANRCRSSEILAAIRKGRVFISFAPDGPAVNLASGPYLMGDTIPTFHSLPVTIVAERVQPEDEIVIISDDGVVHCRIVAPGEDAVCIEMSPRGQTFYRVEVWRWFAEDRARLMAAMSNPIYFEPSLGDPT